MWEQRPAIVSSCLFLQSLWMSLTSTHPLIHSRFIKVSSIAPLRMLPIFYQSQACYRGLWRGFYLCLSATRFLFPELFYCPQICSWAYLTSYEMCLLWLSSWEMSRTPEGDHWASEKEFHHVQGGNPIPTHKAQDGHSWAGSVLQGNTRWVGW